MRERLVFARTQAGLNQRELSLLAGLSSSHIHHIEAGIRKSPSAKVIRAIAAVLGVSIDWLLGGKGTPVLSRMRAAVAHARKRDLAPKHVQDTHTFTGRTKRVRKVAA
jgi:transcriptional regulator with XRE-family HTH domain